MLLRSCFSLALLLLPLLVFSQKKVYTTKKAQSELIIDGLENDPAWQTVEWGANFTQRQPSDGASPSQKTAFKVLYDEKNVYVLIRAFDDDPAKIVKRMSRRDGFEGDLVGISFDSYFDQRSAFSFTASVSGVKGDEAISNNGNDWDASWDPIWYLKTSIDEKGWLAEFRIPLSQLRFGKQEQQIWGIQVSRFLFRKSEESTWPYIPKNSSGWVHLFGELHGIVGIKPQKQLEIMPYLVTQADRYEKEENNPYLDGKDQKISAGIDGKVGITSDVTLDFTVNPDFGQVEADPSQVNLTAFEVFFREQRPFFVESKNILDYQISSSPFGGNYTSDNLFYSRRIGRVPQYRPDLKEGEYMKRVDNATILGAFKLTGKTNKGLSFGVLEAVTAEEKARIKFNGKERREAVEPMTNYLVGRVQQDLNKGQAVVGAIITSTNRNLNSNFSDIMHREAYTGGVDFVQRTKNRNYFASANLVASKVLGSKEAILQTQTSERRFFQRPSTSHVSIDSSATSLSGTGGTFKIGKSGGGNFRAELGGTYRSPELETNDLGYLRSADQINQWVWVGYQTLKEVGIFRNFRANFNQWNSWDFSAAKNSSGLNINLQMQFKNYWRIGGAYMANAQSLSNADLRGGPTMKYQGGNGFWNFISSDERKKLKGGAFHSHYWNKNDAGLEHYYDAEVSYQPFNALQITLFPFYSISEALFQYVDTKDYNSEKRYIVGKIDQQTLGASLRINYIITPNLSIQYYGQPFSSKGTFSEFKLITKSQATELKDRFHMFNENEIAENKEDNTFDIDENKDGIKDYSFNNPNFNFLQFRSNLVLRWEYIPGSTFFVVWSQSRTGEAEREKFSIPNIANGLSNIIPYDVFLIKYTYRFRL